MERYVIEVSDTLYGGNFSTGGVFEVNKDKIWDYVVELAYDLIDSFSKLAEAHEGEDPTDCVDYMALPIGSEWDNVSTAELDAKYAKLGWDSFIDTYTGEYPNL